MHDRLYLRPRAKEFCVDVEFVGHRISAVEVAATVEVNFADIVGDSEQQSTILRDRGSAAGFGRHPAER